jgi:hypothetical protein
MVHWCGVPKDLGTYRYESKDHMDTGVYGLAKGAPVWPSNTVDLVVIKRCHIDATHHTCHAIHAQMHNSLPRGHASSQRYYLPYSTLSEKCCWTLVVLSAFDWANL